MPKAYSYIRMSTTEQLQGDSFRRQTAATKRFVAERSLELDDAFNDIGVSAFRGKNSEFGALSEFLRAVENGRIERGSYLILESLDRLTRQNIMDALGLLSSIINQGIVVVTLQDGQEYAQETISQNITGMMMAVVTLLRAHEESRTKSIRLSAAWGEKKKRARTGIVTGHHLPGWLQHSADGNRILPIPHRVEVVQRMFEMCRDGWGAYSIARHLNESGEAPWGRKATIWQESYIKKILSNRAVLGEYQPHRKIEQNGSLMRVADGDPIPNYYPVVIPVPLFLAAREAASARRTSGKGRKGKSLPNLFSGMLKCDLCGSGIRFIDKGTPPKGGQYLRCSRAVLGGGCAAPYWRYALVEEALLNAIDDIDLEFVLGGPRAETKMSQARNEIALLQQKLTELDAKRENLTTAITIADAPLHPLVKALSLIEGEHLKTQLAIEQAGGTLAELSSQDPAGYRARLDTLQGQIRGDLDDTARAVVRRSLAAEFRRVLRYIRLRPTVRVLWEIEEERPEWYVKLNLSKVELVRLFADYNFEILLSYKNGDVQVVDPLSKEAIRMRSSQKQRIWKTQQRALSEIRNHQTLDKNVT